MLTKGETARRLHDITSHEGKSFIVDDVRFGLSYAGVRLDEHRMGLAALLLHELPPGCSVFSDAGKLAGARASSLLVNLIEGHNPLEKALGIATANAILHTTRIEDERDSLSIMKLTPEDRVAMVGLFTPMVPKIEATGAKLSIIERDASRIAVLDKKDADRILKECSVAIITATTLLNDTLEEVLNSLGNPRHISLLGPSTPLCPEIFQGTPVNHLGGAIVRDTKKVMQIISEGGGTRAMRPYLRFVNLLLSKIS
ncbi:MAG TPA: hypothetical protein DDY17_09080 [Syntrophaceae bacterium]|jgi:uncharacterized protein (DUF4213/DUF364 family)|nr:hypothetical protein [Syntrophaceae bacterium]